jgi:hypothetical protein
MSSNILVCLDDLEHSKKIASYVGKTMNHNEGVQLTLFHCIRSSDLDIGAEEVELSNEDKINIDKILDDYFKGKGVKEEDIFSCQDVFTSTREILKENGFSDSSIKEKIVVQDLEIAACILREAYNHHYNSIVIAKRRQVKLPITKLGVVAENVITNAIGKTIILVSIAT